MFCLKVSDSVDEQGKCFYVNVEPDDFVEEEKSIVQDTIDAISYFECYGFHQGEKSILAYLLPKDRIGPRTQYIQTTTIPSMPVSRLIGRSTISQETWDEVYLIRSKGKGTSRPTVGKRQLPELQPIRPRDWYPKEWKKRKAVGDDKYHMFLTLADGNEEPNPNFDDESLLWGDVFILKVSDELDSEKRSLYEDVDSDGELASKDLRNLINHLNDILRDVTRCVK